MSEVSKAVSTAHIESAIGFFKLLHDELEFSEQLSPSLEASLRAGVIRVMYNLGRASKDSVLRREGRFASSYMIDSSVMAVASTADTGFSGFPSHYDRPMIWAFESTTPQSRSDTIMCDNTGAISVTKGLLSDGKPASLVDTDDQLDCVDTFIGDYFTNLDRVKQII